MQMLQLVCCARLGSSSDSAGQISMRAPQLAKANDAESSSDESFDAFLLDQSHDDPALSEQEEADAAVFEAAPAPETHIQSKPAGKSGSKEAEHMVEHPRTHNEQDGPAVHSEARQRRCDEHDDPAMHSDKKKAGNEGHPDNASQVSIAGAHISEDRATSLESEAALKTNGKQSKHQSADSQDAKSRKKEKKDKEQAKDKTRRGQKDGQEKKAGRTDAPLGSTGTAAAAQGSKPMSKSVLDAAGSAMGRLFGGGKKK
eukprot:TRINITY_DN7806_c0_g2_i1.p1 TRINITY_DN7806_c0_g2~~TRINITY_DN7806_c0_g2_i1.p1  ORF type:complete len:257 (-),score=63.62 TRINITY_DN7806_c0_g2_i1:221-991(-)